MQREISVMTYTAIIAEDEAPQRLEFHGLLQEIWPQLTILELCPDGPTALQALQLHRPQIAFLDIRMPGIDGLKLAQVANDQGTHIVFTTAYEEYAVQAFEEGALDYLLKPVKRERLVLAMERLRKRLASGSSADVSALLNTLQQRLEAPRREPIRWITACVGNTVKIFPVEDVLFFQAQDKYTRVVTAGDEAHIRTPLKELLGLLEDGAFWQVHRAAIVRADAIQAADRDRDGKLTLRLKGHPEILPVSGSFQHRFKGM